MAKTTKAPALKPPASPVGRATADIPAKLKIRIEFGDQGMLGPGRIQLMELISRHGSIAAAGKAMGMSYRRAWLLADTLNKIFEQPLIAKQLGGKGGGSAQLTDLGRDVVGRYRAIEGASATAAAAQLRALRSFLSKDPPSAAGLDDDDTRPARSRR